MAKATNPRKPARDKRKSGAAAKRSARKSAARARKVTAGVRGKTARPRRPARVKTRPSSHRSRRSPPKRSGAAASGAPARSLPSVVSVSDKVVRVAKIGKVAPKTPVIEAERIPPPLPVPIASFTF
jgi:hypothetical protein